VVLWCEIPQHLQNSIMDGLSMINFNWSYLPQHSRYISKSITQRDVCHFETLCSQAIYRCPKLGVPRNHPLILGFSTVNFKLSSFGDLPLSKVCTWIFAYVPRKIYGKLQDTEQVAGYSGKKWVLGGPCW